MSELDQAKPKAKTKATPPLSGSRVASAQALAALGGKALSGQQQAVFDLVLLCKRRGVPNMTGGEIEQAFMDIHGQRVRSCSISGRLNALVASGRLVRLDIRECRVTKGRAGPVAVPDGQAAALPGNESFTDISGVVS